MKAELLPDEPSDLEAEPIEPDDASDLDYVDMPCTDDDDNADCDDDSRWEVFVADDDARDPEPDPDDLQIENGGTDKETKRQGDTEKIVVFDELLVSPSPCSLV